VSEVRAVVIDGLGEAAFAARGRRGTHPGKLVIGVTG
jgi:hypothetical protein